MAETYVGDVMSTGFEMDAELIDIEAEEHALLKEPTGSLANQDILENIGEDASGKMTYKGNVVGHDVDSELNAESKNPVENRAICEKIHKTDQAIAENKNIINLHSHFVEEFQKSIYPTKTIEFSINNDGFAIEIDDTKNCILYQYQGVDNEIPVGTKIESIQFYIDDKWIDIHAMAELDRVAYALNLHKIFPYDDVGGNVFCLWNPTNVVSNKLSSYIVDRIRITYVMPRISFYVDGDLHHVEYAELNGAVQLPDEPQKDGYTFTGWSVDGMDDNVEFPYSVGGADINFVANFKSTPYTAMFYADGMIVDTVNYVAGESITPKTPLKTGYDFAGWEPAIPDEMPAENTSFTALWQAKTYDAVFMVDGEIYKTVPSVFGEKIPLPPSPSKTGYTFTGWTPTVDVMDAEGKTFNASWELKKVNVYFMDGNEVIQTMTADYNTQVNASSEPSKQYYTFKEWKISDETANFPITVGEDDVYIRAEWTRNTIEIGFYKTFYDSFGGYIDNIVYNCGDLLVPPEYPTEEGYVFVGWVDSYMLGGANIPSEFDDAFFDAYRLPEIVPDSNEEGDRLDYYPLYFKGGYIEAEEGYNDSENVWGYQEYQGRYNIFVGGSGSLERGIKNNKPWYDIERDDILYGLWMVFGHGITEITDIPYATFYVYLPSTIKKIHPNTFTSGVKAVYYEGTEEQWSEIEIGENNPNFENTTIYFNQSKITI